ncbi:hypothetical protein YPC_0940 [Yersinia pestis biovar Medievalis str. Harbin 35]|nr:hypothetical protein YPC_0940 [Yersinia pestis biovar Medievalis str. Harbin 35]EEO75558.1 hypothetical protein YP516_3483 [Yersinia pestis Nepal516]EEO83027.1 hypothetical protein YPF_1007 [Yersinia pestis biovar Orientalis str. India 195]EEO87191.1 hypothetical protein YPH_3126 [Yersinia pestis biovar Orientalis str. PEXU2]EEO91254.1 hypothetical protein YPS_1478 [Yersinia pestis Pestoides A]
MAAKDIICQMVNKMEKLGIQASAGRYLGHQHR